MSFSKRPITFVSVKFAENRQRDVTLQTMRQVRTHTVIHENENSVYEFITRVVENIVKFHSRVYSNKTR